MYLRDNLRDFHVSDSGEVDKKHAKEVAPLGNLQNFNYFLWIFNCLEPSYHKL